MKPLYNAAMNKYMTKAKIDAFLAGKMARVAKSKKYVKGQRVSIMGAKRKCNEYVFATSMRWTPYGKQSSTYGAFILLNPRTHRLISVAANLQPL